MRAIGSPLAIAVVVAIIATFWTAWIYYYTSTPLYIASQEEEEFKSCSSGSRSSSPSPSSSHKVTVNKLISFIDGIDVSELYNKMCPNGMASCRTTTQQNLADELVQIRAALPVPGFAETINDIIFKVFKPAGIDVQSKASSVSTKEKLCMKIMGNVADTLTTNNQHKNSAMTGIAANVSSYCMQEEFAPLSEALASMSSCDDFGLYLKNTMTMPRLAANFVKVFCSK